MEETKYVYAVARVRHNELKLLKHSDIEQLITASSYDEVIAHLSNSDVQISGENYDEYLKQQSIKAWNFLKEVAPDIHELDMLLIKNDFQNVKAVLKCMMTDNEPEQHMTVPSVVDTKELIDKLENHEFDSLPEFIGKPAKMAYETITSTHNGQLADMILDRAALDTIMNMGRSSKNDFLKTLAELICVTAAIKTAYRAMKTDKEKRFFEDSVCECDTISKDELIRSALDGEESFFKYISKTKYAGAEEALKDGTPAFEKWCDDIIMEHIMPVKYRAFGVEPLVAYYLAKDAEIKMIRIILSAKYNNLSSGIIRERVRKLYV